MQQGPTDDKSTLVQVMAWCRQATSHYLNQCWPRSPTPYGPNELTHWSLRDVEDISQMYIQIDFTNWYLQYFMWNKVGLNTLRQIQNGCHLADDIFECIFLNENVWI